MVDSRSTPAKICMASEQSNLLSGRYQTEALARHWSQNKNGVCLISSACNNLSLKEDVPHILKNCPALLCVREKLKNYTIQKTSKLDINLRKKILNLCSPSPAEKLDLPGH